MEIQIFGKNDCGKCRTAKSRIHHLIEKAANCNEIKFSFLDMETAEGLALGMFYDVYDIPTTIVRHNEEEVARWNGKPPLSKEVEALLSEVYG